MGKSAEPVTDDLHNPKHGGHFRRRQLSNTQFKNRQSPGRFFLFVYAAGQSQTLHSKIHPTAGLRNETTPDNNHATVRGLP